MDKFGYPDNLEMETIRTWDYNDFHGLMEYIRQMWKYADDGYWKQRGNVYRISTGGWSGNEDIIAAMIGNTMFWMLYWRQSKRGGRYVFAKAE